MSIKNVYVKIKVSVKAKGGKCSPGSSCQVTHLLQGACEALRSPVAPLHETKRSVPSQCWAEVLFVFRLSRKIPSARHTLPEAHGNFCVCTEHVCLLTRAQLPVQPSLQGCAMAGVHACVCVWVWVCVCACVCIYTHVCGVVAERATAIYCLGPCKSRLTSIPLLRTNA